MKRIFSSHFLSLLLVLPAVLFVLSSARAPEKMESVYDEQDNIMLWQAPSAEHWLGTDGIGYDVWDFLRLAIKTDIELFIFPLILFLIVGMSLGIVLSYAKGTLNKLFDGLFNLLNSIPLILILLIIIIVIEGFFPQFNTFEKLFLLFSIFGVVASSKLAIEIRGKIDTIRNSDFVESTIALGVKPWLILFKHIIYYNCMTIIIANVLNFLSQLIFIEITLAYLNLGASGDVLSLGNMFHKYFMFITAFTSIDQWQIAIPSLITIYLITIVTIYANKMKSNVE